MISKQKAGVRAGLSLLQQKKLVNASRREIFFRKPAVTNDEGRKSVTYGRSTNGLWESQLHARRKTNLQQAARILGMNSKNYLSGRLVLRA